MMIKVLILFMLMVSSIVSAQQAIPKIYVEKALIKRIAPEIVYAIALTESGRTLDNNSFRPWPWTLNVGSKSEHYSSMKDMCDALNAHIAKGISQIDIGIMQVNWKYHHQRFESTDAACDPYTNLNVGIQILSESIESTGSLWDGIGRYHSGTEALANKYRQRVSEVLVNHVLSRKEVSK